MMFQYALFLFLNVSSNFGGAHAFDLKSLSDILLPHAAPDLASGPKGEIRCYALPYGAIGIVSHLLTYWTIAWIVVGRSPAWPLHRIDAYGFDGFLAALALFVCIPIASMTMHRCRLTWHFLLICIWKMVTSVSLACTTLHRCWLVRQAKQQQRQQGPRYQIQNNYICGPNQIPMHYQSRNASSGLLDQELRRDGHNRDLSPLYWLILYLAGTIIGMAGLCSLLYTSFRQDETIRKLTYGFGVVLAIIPILVFVHWLTKHFSKDTGGPDELAEVVTSTVGGSMIGFIVAFGFFSSLYSDLVLGSIADNLIGLPSDDFAPLYWAWFFAKRLPLLSI